MTGVWINEAREVAKQIVDATTSRVGRYPSPKGGPGATWCGVIMDTNAPSEDHWWPVLAGEVPVPDHIPQEEALMLQKPDNWKFFNQPGGMLEDRDSSGNLVGYRTNPDAENLKNLPKGYYENMIRGKTKSWIDVYVLNRLGVINDGKPVYQGFTEATHVARQKLKYSKDHTIIVGMDFGLTPAAIFMQRLPNGRWLCLSELVCQDMGAQRFGMAVKNHLASQYPEMDYNIYGDPAGDFRAQTDENTPFDILRGLGLFAHKAPSNDPIIRIEAVNSVLSRMVDGNPGFLVDRDACPMLVNGFLGGYHYRRMRTAGERFEDKPNKNKFSHIHDALQYAVLGGGEGRALLTGAKKLRPFVARSDYSPFDRIKRRNLRNRTSRIASIS